MALRRLVTHNFGLKFLALVLAVGLWFTVVGRERGEVGLNVPLELVKIPKNLVVSNEVPDGVSVRLSGALALTRQVSNRNLRFSLDLSEAQIGANFFDIKAETLDLPRGLEVTRLTPNQINVELEALTEKNLGVLPVIKGSPAPGYMIDELTLVPNQVTVRGPESVLKKMEVVWTEPIDVTNLESSASVKTKPALTNLSLSLVGQDTVEARLKIGLKYATKPFQEVPITVIGAPGEYKMDPEVVEVRLRGPVLNLTEVGVGKGLTVKVNLEGLGPGRSRVPVIVEVPPKIEVAGVEPRQVEVFIKKTTMDEENDSEQ